MFGGALVWSFKRVTVLDFWNKIWNQKKKEGEMKGKERLRQMTDLLRLLLSL